MGNKTSFVSVGGVAVGVVAALVVAACGSSGNTVSSDNGAGSSHASTAPSTTLNVASRGNLGDVLVDSQGRTLYLFLKDSGTTSTCAGACATAWPPATASGTPTAGAGAETSALATSNRPDGTQQLTYDGHPLYTYVGDRQPGDANGQGVVAFGAGWYAVTPSGSPASGQSGGGGNSNNNIGVGGYGN